MLLFEEKRVNIICGHYGSGKTNIAIAMALRLRELYPRAALCDMDTVNPYFRAADAAELMRKHDVLLCAPNFANTNLDVPSLPAALSHILGDLDCHTVADVGGDDDGAVALGPYRGLLTGDDCALWCVINQRRPMIAAPESAAEYVRAIERTAGLPCAGVINNTHLGALTTPDIIRASRPYAEETAKLLGVPLVCTAALAELCGDLNGEENLFPIRIETRRYWNDGRE